MLESSDGSAQLMPKVVAEYKRQARDRIVEAAHVVFRRKGIARSSMEDIAKEVGVSKGALYLYFHTKGELLGALQARFREEVLENWQKLPETGDVAEAIAHSLDTVLTGEVDPSIWHELLTVATTDADVRRALEEDQREDARMMKQFLRRLASQGRITQVDDFDTVSDIVLMLLQGTAARVLMKSRAEEARRKLVRSLRLVLGTSSSTRRPRQAAGFLARSQHRLRSRRKSRSAG